LFSRCTEKANTLYSGHKKTLAVETSQGFLFGWKTVAVFQRKTERLCDQNIAGRSCPCTAKLFTHINRRQTGSARIKAIAMRWWLCKLSAVYRH
jgi:hypothetical protein